MMRAGGGKAKGGNFERFVCKRLSLWLSQGKQDDLFWRSAMSGGRATIGTKDGKPRTAQVGDITAIHPLGDAFLSKFIGECKHVQSLDLESLVAKQKGFLASLWQKFDLVCITYGRNPLLILRQNRLPILIGTNCDGARLLGWNAPQTWFYFDKQSALCLIDFEKTLARSRPRWVVERYRRSS